MKKIFLLLAIALPLVANAQLKIKNGTEYPFKEVQMNYEEHSTGNLLEKYNRNANLEPGATLTLPNCKTFGAGDPLEFNISATDTDGDIYVFGEVDICKTREITFTMEHYVDADGDQSVEDPGAEELHKQQFGEFSEFFEAEFVPVVKSGLLSKYKALMSEDLLNGVGLDIEGATAFTQAMVTKTKTLFAANNAELTPRAPFNSFDFSKPPAPVAYIGANFNGEDGKEPNGYYFLFEKNDDGEWKLDSIFDATGFEGYVAVLEGELDDTEEPRDDTDEEQVRAVHQEEYQSFQDWLHETVIPMIKANKLNDFNKIMVEGVSMTRAEFTKLAAYVRQKSPEIQPNSDMDLLQEIKPVVFLGKNYMEDNQEGFIFVFELSPEGDWKISEFGPAVGD